MPLVSFPLPIKKIPSRNHFYIGGFCEELIKLSSGKTTLEINAYAAGVPWELHEKNTFYWYNNLSKITQAILDSRLSDTDPIYLSGHSYGGDSAYKVARRLNKAHCLTYLVTFDPVSRWNFHARKGEHPGTCIYWVNIARPHSTKNLFYRPNFTAFIGHPWKLKTGADLNFPTEENHGDVPAMIKDLYQNIPLYQHIQNHIPVDFPWQTASTSSSS